MAALEAVAILKVIHSNGPKYQCPALEILAGEIVPYIHVVGVRILTCTCVNSNNNDISYKAVSHNEVAG